MSRTAYAEISEIGKTATRNSFKGHADLIAGDFLYFGHGFKLPAPGNGQMARAEKRNGRVYILDAVTGETIVYHTGSAKWWAAPVA